MRYERWLAEVIAACRVLAVDEGTAERYADVRDELKRGGRPIPGNDVWIAALARQHGMPLVSRDQHFDFVSGLKRAGQEAYHTTYWTIMAVRGKANFLPTSSTTLIWQI